MFFGSLITDIAVPVYHLVPDVQQHISSQLTPCYICGRTFLPAPLTKHVQVCERNATKKRKVFNSLKQRVEGTDLAPFHQRSYLKREDPCGATAVGSSQLSATVGRQITGGNSDARRGTWKQKHQDLVNAIRAAKGNVFNIY